MFRAAGLRSGLACWALLLGLPTAVPAQWGADRLGAKVAVIGDREEGLPEHAVARLGTLRFRHEQPLSALVVSPDGAWVAAQEGDGVRLWDARTGKDQSKQLNKFRPLGRPLCFSPDGRYLAVRGPRLDLWDLWTQQPILLHYPGDPRGKVEAAAFSPDGARFAHAAGKRVVVWNVARRTLCHALEDPPEVRLLAFSGDGKHLGLVEAERVELWHLDGGERTLLPESAALLGLAFSADGQAVTGVCADATGRGWDLRTGKFTRCWEVTASDIAAVWSNADVATTRGTLDTPVWEVARGKKLCAIDSLSEELFACAAERKVLLTASPRYGLRRWDVTTGKQLRGAFPGHNAPVQEVRFSPAGDLLASVDDDGHMVWWNPQTGNIKYEADVRCFQQGRRLTFSPDGRRLFFNTAHNEEAVQAWDVRTRRSQAKFADSYSWVESVDVSPDGKYLLYSSGQHMSLCLWSLRAGARVPTPLDDVETVGENGRPRVTAFLPDGRTFAALHRDRICFVDGESAATLCQLEAETVSVTDRRGRVSERGEFGRMRLAANRWYLAVTQLKSDADFEFLVWDMASGKPIGRWSCPGAKEAITDLALSPDGRILATTEANSPAVRLWDVRTGEQLAALKGHKGAVTSLDFAPDGRTLATGSADATIVLWDVARLAPAVLVPAAPLSRLWRDLASSEPREALDAADGLVAGGATTLELLTEHLRPVRKPDETALRQLLADLDARDFLKRERAARELALLGPVVAAELRAALAAKPTLEVKRRLQALLDDSHPWIGQPETRRAVRAVLVVERIGTAEAARLLRELAGGTAEAPVTREARAAYDRLRRRLALTPPHD